VRIVSDSPPRSVSRALHDAGASAWEAATTHPMVRSIGDGTLPHPVFRGYFEQNVLYLQEYARAIALVLAKAPDGDAIATLGAFLGQIVRNEIPANLRFLERLGADPAVAAVAGTAGMRETTYAYTRHLLAVCAQGTPAEGLAAVLPCQWSYGEIARPLLAAPPEDPIYADWIAMFGNDEYDALVGATTRLLDRLADPGDPEVMSSLSAIFDRSISYEASFWDMAYAPGAPRASTPAPLDG
jgi:thiaminase/transcriptional activator TenA